MFNILAPINSLEGFDYLFPLLEEIYFSVKYNDIIKQHSDDNWNSFSHQSEDISIGLKESQEIIERCKKSGIKAFIVLNKVPLNTTENTIKKYISAILKLTPDGLIVRDIFLCSLIRELDTNIEIHISSLNQVLNSYAVKFRKYNFEANRIIFPRNISYKEIISICNQFPDLKFEIFIKNGWCYNSDGFCMTLHNDKKTYVCKRELLYKNNIYFLQKKFLLISKYKLNAQCKVCMFKYLGKLNNLTAVKIVGRTLPYKFIKKDIIFLKLVRGLGNNIDFPLLFKKIYGYSPCEYCEFY